MVARRALRIILDDGYPVKTSTLTEKLRELILILTLMIVI
jgi:hypothetical protein